MDTLHHSQLTSLLQVPTFLPHKQIMVTMELVGMVLADMADMVAMELVDTVMEEI